MTPVIERATAADDAARASGNLAVRALTLGIAGIRFTISSQSPDLLLDVNSPARPFLLDSTAPADCAIEARWGAISETAPGRLVFDSGALWKQYSDGADQVFRFHTSFFGPLPYKECRVRANFAQAEVLLHRDYLDRGRPLYPLEYPLDEILMFNLLSQSRGMEVHSCGIEDRDGQGYLFLGQSGAGKTTTARLWDGLPGVRILSDDRIVLRIEDGELWMYGTPWHGEGQFASPARARLDRIYFLGRAPVNSVAALTRAEAMARLMACSFVPFHSRSGLDFTLEFLQQVTQLAPSAELRFVPDGNVVNFVRSGSPRIGKQ